MASSNLGRSAPQQSASSSGTEELQSCGETSAKNPQLRSGGGETVVSDALSCTSDGPNRETVFDSQLAGERRARDAAAASQGCGLGWVSLKLVSSYEWLYAVLVTSSIDGNSTTFAEVSRMVIVSAYLVCGGVLAMVPLFVYLGLQEEDNGRRDLVVGRNAGAPASRSAAQGYFGLAVLYVIFVAAACASYGAARCRRGASSSHLAWLSWVTVLCCVPCALCHRNYPTSDVFNAIVVVAITGAIGATQIACLVAVSLLIQLVCLVNEAFADVLTIPQVRVGLAQKADLIGLRVNGLVVTILVYLTIVALFRQFRMSLSKAELAVQLSRRVAELLRRYDTVGVRREVSAYVLLRDADHVGDVDPRNRGQLGPLPAALAELSLPVVGRLLLSIRPPTWDEPS